MVQQEALSRFSTAFKTWFTQDLPVKQWLNDAYAKYNVRGKKWELLLPAADLDTAPTAYPALWLCWHIRYRAFLLYKS